MSVQKLADEFLAKRDEKTFGKLQKRLAPGLNNYIYNYIQDKETRESVIQNTFANIWTKIHQYNSNFAFSTWAYRIARNEALLSKRWGNKTVSVETALSAANNISFNNETTFTPEYEFYNLGEEGDFDTLYNFIIEEMKNLGDKYVDIMFMKEIKKMKYEEIEKVTGLNKNTIKTRVRLARIELANRSRNKFPEITNKMFGQ